MEWREADGVRWLEADLGGARAAFSTRQGGVSEAPFDSLNLGLLTDDDAETVFENRRRLTAVLGIEPERVAYGRQVHGATLASRGSFSTAEVQKEPRGGGPESRGSFCAPEVQKEPRSVDLPEADGQIVREPGVAGLVFVADCLPVALYGPEGVAMLHCGWRPLAAGIVADGAAAVGATAAAIGPGIGPCCYEVGEEVLGAFSHLGEGIADGRMLDLPEVARRLIVAAGVTEIESAGLCTSCESELFFSHRRDAGRTGRQAGLAWLNSEEG
ncbi:MAG TPA: polyphenol oxidase family protein [Solirubrobacterales bacterium]|nr:polyphenol oxidase family protein [Solirubrobacterales bacterium]